MGLLRVFEGAASGAPGSPGAPGVPEEDVLRHRVRLFLLRAPLLPALAGCCGVIFGGEWLLLSLAALVLCWVLGQRRMALLCVLCMAVVGLRLWAVHRAEAEALPRWEEAGTLLLRGTVVRELGSGVVLRLDGSPLRVSLHGDELDFEVGDRVEAMGELRPRREAPVPGMFDSGRWMQGLGIAGSFSAGRAVYLGRAGGWYGLLGLCATGRSVLADRLMPPGTEGDARRQVLCALLLGARDRADELTLLDFRRGGCLHAFAVSGLHVGLVAMMLWPLLRRLRVRPVVARPLLLVLMAVYVLLTGAQAPALRAYVMMAAVMVGVMLVRRVCLTNVWCLAALVLLMVDPQQLWQPGFQLSFAVYAAICLGVAFCRQDRPWFGPDPFIPYRIMTRWEQRLAVWDRGLRGVTVVALSAWLVSVPLCILHFHTVNPWSFVTNMAITPLLLPVMVTGAAALLLGGLPWVGPLVQALACRCSGWLIAVVGFCGGLPGAYWAATPPEEPDSWMLMGLGFGKSACMLGNPGLLVGSGSEGGARWTIEPAVFHAGYTPAALLTLSDLRSAEEGAARLSQAWPGMRVLRPGELRGRMLRLRTRAGVFLICGPPADLPDSPAVNQGPVVLWEQGGRRLLYVGDAAGETYRRLPREERRADVIVLGHNAAHPADPLELQRECGARWVWLLPSLATAADGEAGVALPPGARVLGLEEVRRNRLGDDGGAGAEARGGADMDGANAEGGSGSESSAVSSTRGRED